MKLSLVVLAQGKQEGKVLPIALSQFVIGRDPQCHLRPASPSISKRHCALLERDGKFFVVDFDSTNGTFLNEEPVKGEREVKDGDQLKVGPLMFAIKLEAGAPVKPPPPPAIKKPAVPAPAAQKTAPDKPAEDKAATPPPEKKAPAKAPAPSSSSGGEADDDIAAMLLSLGDEGTGEVRVPEGSTVHEMTVPDLPGETPPGEGGQPKEKEKEKPKPAASTSSAAKAILEQYMKRPRPS